MKTCLYTYLLLSLVSTWAPAALAFAPPLSQHHRGTTRTRTTTTTTSAGTSSSSSRRMMMMDPAHAVTDFYTHCLANHPLPTQSLTAGVFAGLGDALAQYKDLHWSEQQKDSNNSKASSSYDPVRTFHYVLKGLGGGILWSYWFQLADPWSDSLAHMLFPGAAGDAAANTATSAATTTDILQAYSWMSTAATRTLAAIALEQFLVCPVLYAAWDIPLIALLSGSATLDTVPARVQSKLAPLLLANAKVWTPVNIITYNLPAEWRVLFTSVADIVWQSVNSATLAASGSSSAVEAGLEQQQEKSSSIQQPPRGGGRTTKNSLVPATATTTVVV